MANKEHTQPSPFYVAGIEFVNPAWLEKMAKQLADGTEGVGADSRQPARAWDDAMRLADALDALSSALHSIVMSEVREKIKPGNALAGEHYLYRMTKPSTRTYLNEAVIKELLPLANFADFYQEPRLDTRKVRKDFPPKERPDLYRTTTSSPHVKIEKLVQEE